MEIGVHKPLTNFKEDNSTTTSSILRALAATGTISPSHTHLMVPRTHSKTSKESTPTPQKAWRILQETEVSVTVEVAEAISTTRK